MYMWGDYLEEKNSESILSKLNNFSKNPQFVKIVVIVGFVGIALILFSGFFTDSKQSNDTERNSSQIAYVSLTEYENQLEQSLAEIICAINGAGTTKVMLTMDSTVEQVFAADKNMSQSNSNNLQQSDSKNSKDITAESSYITVELSNGTEQTVLVKEIQPKVRGVLVVCAGGDNSVVKEKVIDAVTKALDISSSKVSVVGLAQ